MVAGNVVTEKDGVPILFPECKRGFVVRVVHPQNQNAPSRNLSISLLYLAPGGVLEPHNQENEGVYAILEGQGKGHFGLDGPIAVERGIFMHLPPYAEHGLENTGTEMMLVMIATSPTLPSYPEWATQSP